MGTLGKQVSPPVKRLQLTDYSCVPLTKIVFFRVPLSCILGIKSLTRIFLTLQDYKQVKQHFENLWYFESRFSTLDINFVAKSENGSRSNITSSMMFVSNSIFTNTFSPSAFYSRIRSLEFHVKILLMIWQPEIVLPLFVSTASFSNMKQSATN